MFSPLSRYAMLHGGLHFFRFRTPKPMQAQSGRFFSIPFMEGFPSADFLFFFFCILKIASFSRLLFSWTSREDQRSFLPSEPLFLVPLPLSNGPNGLFFFRPS